LYSGEDWLGLELHSVVVDKVKLCCQCYGGKPCNFGL
jgi:hypothetical protein